MSHHKSGREATLSALLWHKSSYSSEVRHCVEIASADRAVAARDSKDPEGGVLLMSSTTWSAFLHGIRDGRFEH